MGSKICDVGKLLLSLWKEKLKYCSVSFLCTKILKNKKYNEWLIISDTGKFRNAYNILLHNISSSPSFRCSSAPLAVYRVAVGERSCSCGGVGGWGGWYDLIPAATFQKSNLTLPPFVISCKMCISIAHPPVYIRDLIHFKAGKPKIVLFSVWF